MSEGPVAPRRRRGPGCLTRVMIVVAALVALFFIIGLAFDQGEDANQPARGFNAGAAEEYQRGDISYIEARHIFVTRLLDGSFVVLYDRSPRQQALRGSCRVAYDEMSTTGSAEQVAGFKGALVEQCGESTTAWLVSGEPAFGADATRLDRFDHSIDDNGDLIVDLESRHCLESVGVPGIPPYRDKMCRGAP